MLEPSLVAEVAETIRMAAKIAPSVPIGPETRLIEDLAIDSLDLVGVFLKIQDRFDLAIDDEAIPALRRVADVARYVAQGRGSVTA
jgi:acyl carrier protein